MLLYPYGKTWNTEHRSMLDFGHGGMDDNVGWMTYTLAGMDGDGGDYGRLCNGEGVGNSSQTVNDGVNGFEE